ncbi:conserved hypothetical protein [Luteimonas sp. 9C]|nr:conserved hypothetical protein [Luteimonas sp. 9C]
MKMLRIMAAGAASYFAYRAWKRNRDAQTAEPVTPPRSLADDGARTAPHGDPLIADAHLETSTPRSGAHASPGFGAP